MHDEYVYLELVSPSIMFTSTDEHVSMFFKKWNKFYQADKVFMSFIINHVLFFNNY